MPHILRMATAVVMLVFAATGVAQSRAKYVGREIPLSIEERNVKALVVRHQRRTAPGGKVV
jgi:sporulation protein YlmC with PRC-barrel domain